MTLCGKNSFPSYSELPMAQNLYCKLFFGSCKNNLQIKILREVFVHSWC